MDWTIHKLERSGFTAKPVRKRVMNNAPERNLIEIIDTDSTSVLARVIANAKRRFGVRIYVSPILKLSENVSGLMYPSNDLIVDFERLGSELNVAPILLLHEIRHAYFAERLRLGVQHDFAGYFIAAATKTLGASYERYVSLEEISNYARDLAIAKTRFGRGELGKAEFMSEIYHAKGLFGQMREMISSILITDYRILDISYDSRMNLTEVRIAVLSSARTEKLGDLYLKYVGNRSADYVYDTYDAQLRRLLSLAERSLLEVETTIEKGVQDEAYAKSVLEHRVSGWINWLSLKWL